MHPHYRRDRHFRNACRMAGKVYMPMRTLAQVSCKGSSDAIPVEKDEFARTVDAAVRVARSFGGGVAECGLVCDPRVLATDPGYDALSGWPGGVKALPLPHKFPCSG